MTRLVIARHGNTFESGQTPRRVGARTDLPLTETGCAQGRALGLLLRARGLIPARVYTGSLRRIVETAREAMDAAGVPETTPTLRIDFLNEIDYGPDEDRTEEEVRARVGEDALKAWDENGTPPPGWVVDPKMIVEGWHAFARDIRREEPTGTVLAVTSNGVARFAPCLTGDMEGFRRAHPLKISTGALCVLSSQEEGGWRVEAWNLRPSLTS